LEGRHPVPGGDDDVAAFLASPTADFLSRHTPPSRPGP
jgi:hypothetical protein